MLTVFKAQGEVGDSVLHQARMATRDGIECMRVLFRGADEVPVTRLKGKAVRKRCETGDDVDDWGVNGTQVQCRQGALPIAAVLRVDRSGGTAGWACFKAFEIRWR